ncbi:hypothetical protein BT93_K1015 [Corymbia citriodora subsp. variegata]|nr:hypothetical protein BT93_K1015 [Corymbia citriodora subsp. variegata]
MYKSKLQKLCQQRSWSLPEYSSVKDGPDHMPRFTGTVFVNGHPFHTPNACRSSKEAQKEAAKLAYDHFSASRTPPREPPRLPPLPPPSDDGSYDSAGTRSSSENTILQRYLASLDSVQPKLPGRNDGSKVTESHLFVGGSSSENTIFQRYLASFDPVQPKLPGRNDGSKVTESHLLVGGSSAD